MVEVQDKIIKKMFDQHDKLIDDPQLIPCRSLSVLESLNIYSSSIRNSLRDCLLQNYPMTLHLVGKECFESLANMFSKKHPPKNPDLSQYGQELSLFVKNVPELKGVPYLSDFIKLEHALNNLSPKDNASVNLTFDQIA